MNLFHNILRFCEIIFSQIDLNLCGNKYDVIGKSTNWIANNLNQYTSILRASQMFAHPSGSAHRLAAPSGALRAGSLRSKLLRCISSPRDISHDLDGNMFSDGIMDFTYDAANRLKTVSSNGVLIVTNFYDAKSRRVKKVTQEATATFFYDGWNLIEERIAYTNGTSSAIHYYWGKDLSGTFQGAGGVGGLLYLTIDDMPYIPTYDNNGNIARYLDASGNTVAQYTYDAFGNLISKSGPLADFFRHRFSTKHFDAETGMYDFGRRFYLPCLCRWMLRDPIAEEGGLNIYGYCFNDPLSLTDARGEKISISEEKSVVKDKINTKSRGAFFRGSSVTFSCSMFGRLHIEGNAYRRIEILTPGLDRWNVRYGRYDDKWGRQRSSTTEWQATYAHEQDHWNSFNSFFAFLRMLNEFDGTFLCHKCGEMKDDLERQYRVLWLNAVMKSAKYDVEGYNYGGAYPK